jgi:molybdenum cofactor cytidylyltransferase
LSRAEFKTAVVILAAGASSRMGRPKLLLPWKDSTVLAHLLATWTQLGARQIAVVLPASGSKIPQELDRLGFDVNNRILNPRPEQGMFSSIQCAARWTGWKSDVTHWLISLGDQPHVLDKTLASLLSVASKHSDRICQPEWQSRPKHPVILPRAAFESLAGCDDRDLRAFLEKRSELRKFCPVDDPGLDLDLDYPKDYEEALRRTRPG